MGSGQHITEDEFRLIKSKCRSFSVDVVAEQVGRSEAIVAKIAACRTFAEYERIKKAEHPPVKNSMKDRMAELERWREQEVDPYIEHEQRKKTEEAAGL